MNCGFGVSDTASESLVAALSYQTVLRTVSCGVLDSASGCISEPGEKATQALMLILSEVQVTAGAFWIVLRGVPPNMEKSRIGARRGRRRLHCRLLPPLPPERRARQGDGQGPPGGPSATVCI